MNNARRQTIAEIRTKLEELGSMLDTLIDEETAAFDNLPESLQSGERGDKMQEAISELENPRSDMQNIDTYLETAAA